MHYASPALTVPIAAVLLLLAVPAAMTSYRGWAGRLTRENRLGLHTPAAVASEDAFKLANRVASPLVAGAAGVAAVCGLLVLAVPLGTVGAIVVGVLGLVGALGQMYVGSAMGERAAMTVPRPARKSSVAGCCGAGGACGCGAHGGGAGNGAGAAAAGTGRSSGAAAAGAGRSSGGAAASAIPDLLPDATVR